MQRGLKVIQGPKDVGRVVVIRQGKCTFGRAEGCTIVLASEKVSKRHCEFTLTAEEFFVKDLGSSNGTFVNGEPVKESRLARGDHVQLGDYVFEVVVSREATNAS